MSRGSVKETPEFKLATKFNEAIGDYYRNTLFPIPTHEILGAASLSILAHLRLLKNPDDRMDLFEEMAHNTVGALLDMEKEVRLAS